jgi:hypothetical protein
LIALISASTGEGSSFSPSSPARARSFTRSGGDAQGIARDRGAAPPAQIGEDRLRPGARPDYRRSRSHPCPGWPDRPAHQAHCRRALPPGRPALCQPLLHHAPALRTARPVAWRIVDLAKGRVSIVNSPQILGSGINRPRPYLLVKRLDRANRREQCIVIE